MKSNKFITEDFLLHNQQAKDLYNNYAKEQPIIDYHNHLSPKEIAEDRQFDNITQVWIAGDHYKWRAMRTMGVDEKYITGDATDKEKFMAWAKTVPHTLRNPLFHWTHLELQRYFGIDELLNEASAERIYDAVNEKLKQPEYSCRGLLKKMGVETLCTTEDPVDSLKYHQQLAKSDFEIKVSTAFRPDKAVLIDAPTFNAYIDQLTDVAETPIETYKDLQEVLRKRIEFFHENGCRLCDHGLNSISFEDYSEEEIAAIFSKKRNGEEISPLEVEKFKTAILVFLGETYQEFGWVQQFHLGALRNNNKRMLEKLGPDTGWDSIGDYTQAEKISQFLNHLDGKDKLAKTILYNLNPADNAVFASMIGNFNDGSIKGKVQFGSGWWFLDQKQGIIDQLDALSNMGLVSVFIGMLTDSRSFLSFPRHEYFRRVLCNLFGEEMAKGELPDDLEMVGKTIANISYNNAKEYFDF
ncbi:glucuronate isomerase [Salinimicrobium oceani]|uniref:Uronate isomerase n=1 Tax=Salinimicrobium oceani TaxID=2722702 RepID=A0ABX1CYT9_9FLAO|nr:glucuronate isomerase [Salinimicrobium oceani]NJW52104.1 glucuronate isomerase [Salinimicrobium oceani]